jgi:hypothetical protein
MQGASVGAAIIRKSQKAIRFARQGCTNRPFYHIVVMEVSIFAIIFNL